jgi:hypothetical protein
LDASQTVLALSAKQSAPAVSMNDEIFVSLTIMLNKIQKYYFIMTGPLKKVMDFRGVFSAYLI